jgi:carbamoyltransferase
MGTYILGVNAFHGDASACLLCDGKLIAAAEEERFRRIKHWAGFPSKAIEFCLSEANITIDRIDHVAINRNPKASFFQKIIFTLSQKPSLALLSDRFRNATKLVDFLEALALNFNLPRASIKAKVHYVEHHMAHMASSFFVSPFDQASVVSVDGFGDFTSTMWGLGNGAQITVKDRVRFPHSLGLFYLAITQYLGFPNYGDEYKVMGLAPYGKPVYLNEMRRLVSLLPNGRFNLNLDYFLHHSHGVAMLWNDGEPKIGRVFSVELENLLGPSRSGDDELLQCHKDIAASAQFMYEEVFFHLLNHVANETKNLNLALAGGCAMNSVANGKIFDRTPFKKVYIQSAAGDSGGAIGAAYVVWHKKLRNVRCFQMEHSYWGPDFSTENIKKLLDSKNQLINSADCVVTKFTNESDLCAKTAQAISEGNVIGWFQGKMEWGPRALGNRSILGDPRRSNMKDILNLKIKRRESFRPFAPSILREATKDWFEVDYDVPFMLQVFQIKKNKRDQIPAVTHVNGSGRLQTVSERQNSRYHQLIKSFESITGVPILLNTSFNENEPVVCTPEEALNCFLRTKMDILVLGDYVVERKKND